VKIEIKGKYGAKHKNIIKVLHPTLRPPNGFINLMTHPQTQKELVNIF
jgi:hypothetical protein